MSDTEILDWLNENMDMFRRVEGNRNYPARFVLDVYDITARGKSIREAVCIAAAKWREVNGDFSE